MTRILIVLITAIFPAWLWAEDPAPDVHQLDFSKAWFKPYLIENNDEACGTLLKDAQDKFFSNVDFGAAYGLQGYGYSENGKILDWEMVGGETPNQIEAYGKTFYLSYINNPGCGGACETNQPLISDSPFPDERDYKYLEELAKAAPPAASYSYTITKKPDGSFYLFIVGTAVEYKDQLLVYRLAQEGKWKSACKVALAPEHVEEKNDTAFSPAIHGIKQLDEAVGGLSRGAGSCGSLGTHGRWQDYLHHELYKTLWRPWAINSGVGQYGGNSYGHYDISMENLEQWQLTGISERQAFLKYKEQLDQSIKDLSLFYQNQFSWSTEQSKKTAELALKNAISRGIGFYMYEPFPSTAEKLWRAAIFDKAPEDRLHSLPVEDGMKNVTPKFFGGEGESLLNVAISHTVALSILLEKGLNPNAINAFGKTPLMYAAQYNEFESAKLLLDHGADPNAATVEPSDNCYYTLETFNMTPLHYAVRYASPEFVKLLMDHGAEPFIKARNERLYPAKEETPLDWLHRYTAADAPEKNPNIPADKVTELEHLLKLPTADELASIASKSILQAEKDFQEGRAELAYRQLRRVLNLQPENERALSDMSLVALKQGEVGPSLEASEKLIKTSKDDQLKANAWFNQGLACENNNSAFYNGHSYCAGGTPYLYMQSLALKPTAARQKKLLEVLQAGESCQLPYQDKNIKLSRGRMPDPAGSYRERSLIYVLHENGQALRVDDFGWDQQFHQMNGENKIEHITPKLLATYALGEKSMTVLNTGDVGVQFPYSVGNWTCKDGKSPAVPKDTTAPAVH
ncbi:MAG TPA: ankyrin repeat domain-containing protein [Pseudomonadales bacterium]|nr:ankyrin repeat domain-containing protein [Pseudomonadales bacterium]